MPSVFITGANRGIGLELARQYIADDWRVFATCRNPQQANELTELAEQSGGQVSLHALDVGRHGQIETLAQEMQDESIDILINNAGIYPEHGDDIKQINYEDWMEAFRINSMAPLKVASAFLNQVQQSDKKLIVTISSKVGSIGDNRGGLSYLYRSSKTAVNQVMKSLSIDLKDRGVTVLIMHPGWVQTDMGGPNALIDVETSVRGMRSVFDGATLANTGQYIAYDGASIPW